MLQITLNVTNLIQTVQKRNILFYPAIMHILLSACRIKEKIIFFELGSDKYFKTLFHPVFEEFYKNYVYTCYAQKTQQNFSKDDIVFALNEKNSRADFILLPFQKNHGQTFLNLIIRFDIPDDFEAHLQHAALNF